MPVTHLDSNGILWVNDSNPYDGLRETFMMSTYLNHNGVVVGTGIDVVGQGGWLDGNNVAGTIGLTLEGTATLSGSLLVTNFDAMGIFGSGYANHIIGAYAGAIEVASVRGVGIGVSGGATVMNAEVHASGSGFVGWGGLNNFWYDLVYDIGVPGSRETVALSMGGGADVYEFHAQGSASNPGWSMVWAGAGGPYTISNSSFTGFDSAIANVGHVTLTNTVVQGLQYAVVNQDTLHFHDNGGNTLSVIGPHTDQVIYGTSGVDHILGDARDNTIVGGGGADVIFGGPGADTFVFSPNVMSVAPDFDKAAGDQIYLAYHYPTSVVTFVDHTLFVDGVAYVHIPGANSIADVAYHF